MDYFHEERIYRVSYFIKILDRGGVINKSDVMDKFSISEKTVRRNMLIVIDIMRELYGKVVIWDKKQKLYRVYKNINEC